MKKLRKKIEKLHDLTIDSDACYDNKLIKEDIDFLSLFTIAGINKTVIEFDNDRLCALNYNYNTPSIIIIYEISHLDTNKRVSDKMMKLIEALEDFYIVLDDTFVIKENSVSYLLVIKNLNENRIGEIELK